MKSFTNEPTNISFNKIVLNSVVTLTADSSGDTWTLVLPTDTGINGQVFTTDGNGTASWTTSTVGSVTSVQASVPAFLEVLSDPVISDGTIAITFSGSALPTANGGTGSTSASTGSGGVVLSSAPTIDALNLTGTTDVGGDVYMDSTALYLMASPDVNHGIKFSGVDGNNGPDIFGHTRGQLSIQGTKTMSWDSSGIDVVEAISAKSMTLTNALPVTSGGTGVTVATGSTNLVLSDSPFIISPTLTTPIIKGTFFNTIITTQASEAWTLSLPVDGGSNGEVFTTNGSGVITWSAVSTGTVTSVAASVPTFLSISGSPITESGTLAITLSGSALPTTSGGTGSTSSSTGTGGVVLSNSPALTTPDIVGTSFSTTLDTEATADYTFKLPVDGGTSNQIFRSDGDGTNSWMGLAVSMGILGGSLSVAASTLSAITDNTQGVSDNDTAITNGFAAQGIINLAQTGVNSLQALTNTAQGLTNTALATATTNLGNATTANLLQKLSTVGISAPAFLTAGSAVTTIDGTGGTLSLTLSGDALPVLNGGTGVTTSTGIGDTVLSNGPSLDSAFLKDSIIEGPVFGTILKSAATSDWTLTLPVDDGTNLQLLRTNGSGTTTWAAVSGTGDVVLKSAPSIDAPLLTDPKIAGGTFNTTIDTQATENWTLSLPVDGGSSNEVLTSSGAGVTTWSSVSTGTVTSVAASVPDFLSISGSPITESGTLAITLSGTALPVVNGGTGVTSSTGTGSVVLGTSPTISDLTTTGTTNMATLVLTNDLAITSGGTGTSTATGTGSVVLATSPTISDLNTTGTTNMETLALTTALPTASGGTGATGASTGTGGVVLKNSPLISNLTTTGTTNMATLALTNALPTASGGTGVTGASTGLGGVVLKTGPSISTLTCTGLTTMGALGCGAVICGTIGGAAAGFASLTLTTQLSVANGGTGVTTSTGTTSVVLSSAPTIDALNLTGVTDVGGDIFLNMTGLYLLAANDTNHGIKYSNAGGNNGPDIFAFSRGQLSIQGTKTMSWDSSGIDVVEAISAKSMTLTNALPVTSGGTGVTAASTGTGGLVLSKNPYIRGDGAQKYACQFQDNTGVDTSIAITTGENDLASIFFGTNFGDSKTGAHKNAIISKGIPSFSRADLHFCLNNASDNTTSASIADSRMMIEPDGNVGIGTVAPASALDVNGTITVTDIVLTNALPVSGGGTGTTSSTGSGSLVLATAPTFSGGVNFTGVTKILVPGAGEKDVLYLGESNSTRETAIFSWEGDTDSTSNHLKLGFFGVSDNFEFGVDGVLTMSELKINTRVDMNDKPVQLRNGNTTHGLAYSGTVDGPDLFGQSKGRLSTGGSGRMWWNSNGISTNDSDYFQYTTGTWTPGIDGVAGGTVDWNNRSARWKRIGNIVSFSIELDVSVTSTGGGSDSTIWFTGFPFSSSEASWQRIPIGMGIVATLDAPFWFEIQQSSTLMYPKYGNNLNVKLDFTGDGDFIFITNGTFLI